MTYSHLRLGLTLTTLMLLLILSSCSTDNTPDTPDLPLAWGERAGGSNTMCSDGSAYKYFVHGGSVNKLVIDFQGGGACWDDNTCSSSDTYAPNLTGVDTSDLQGLRNHTEAQNPVKDWHHVFVPYCTGDLGIGDNDKTYTNPATQDQVIINHRGAHNVRSVLDWVFENYEKPETILITGCSAGAYTSVFWAETLAKQYGNSTIVQFGDSGAGVSNDLFPTQATANWNTPNTLISAVGNTTFDKDYTPNTYIALGNAYPSMTLSQYNTLADEVQIQFYGLMLQLAGSTLSDAAVAQDWSNSMSQSLVNIRNQASNFTSYTANGSEHCIIPGSAFYTTSTNGTSLVSWVDDLISGTQPGVVTP